MCRWVQREKDVKVGEGEKENKAVIASNVSLKILMLGHSWPKV